MRNRCQRECQLLRRDLCAYLDGELVPGRCPRLIRHLEQCAGCSARISDFHDLGQTLRSLPMPPVPPGLEVRLQVRAAQHTSSSPLWTYWRMRWSSAFRALALPTTVGTVAALALFAALAGGVAVPAIGAPGFAGLPATASPPGLAFAGYSGDLGAVLIQAQVNATGHVFDYRLLSGPASAQQLERLNEQLRSTLFRPAMTASGHPTAGSVVLSFGTVNVRG